MDSHVVQVSNVSPSATVEQIHTLFNFLGPIDELEIFPKLQDPGNPETKVSFIKFTDGASVGIAQHLTNTVFIDRPLICVPYNEGIIPDEASALQFVGPANAVAPGMQIGSMDPAKLDEIRRTIYVGNLDSKTATAEQLKSFFASCGKVEFVRMAGDETQPTRFAFIEFADVDHVQKAMELNGALFEDRPLKINHSNNAIVKPPVPGAKPANDSTSREIDEAMRRVREAQTLISRALESDGKSGKRSRSRSRSRHRRRRSRSRDRSRKRRSRSRSYGRSRRSRSRDRRRSRRSRSRSRDRRRKRSRSRSSRRRSSSRSPGKKSSKSHRKDRKKDREHKHSSKGSERSKSDKPENGEKAKKKENGSAEVEA